MPEPKKISKMSKKAFWVKSSRSQWKTKHTVQIMNCKLKTNENERGIWGFEFGLTEMCFPPPGSRHKYKLTMILRQYYGTTILATSFLFLPQITGCGRSAPSLDLSHYSRVLGGVVKIHLII